MTYSVSFSESWANFNANILIGKINFTARPIYCSSSYGNYLFLQRKLTRKQTYLSGLYSNAHRVPSGQPTARATANAKSQRPRKTSRNRSSSFHSTKTKTSKRDFDLFNSNVGPTLWKNRQPNFQCLLIDRSVYSACHTELHHTRAIYTDSG